MRMKRFIGLAAAMTMALSLSACSGSSNEPDGKDTKGSDTNKEASATGEVRVWFMEGSISDEASKWLEKKFAEENKGSTLKVEVQQWDGIVAKLQTSLASDNESPDLVEIGNTQNAAFAAYGALADVTELKDELGGDDLIPSFVDAATFDDKIYAYPLYAGARAIFYRKDLMKQAGIEQPQTIDELHKAIIDLTKANPEKKDKFSGIYLAAVDAHGVESLLFSKGFDYAVKDGDTWKAKVSDPQSMEALKMIQDIFKNGTHFGQDSQSGQKSFERNFNDGSVGMLIGTGNIGTKIDKKLWDEDKVGVMAVPSDTAGTPGKVFAGGSNIAMSAKSKNPELAKKALKLIFSEEFQKFIAKDGWVPGNTKYGDAIEGPFSEIAQKAVANSKLTPNTPQWGVAVGDNKVNDFFTKIAKGDNLEAVAKEFNTELDEVLNKK